MKKDYCTQSFGNLSTKIYKLLIVILIFICGCETTQTSSTLKSKNRNPKCEDVTSFKVFQVLDKYVLANVCQKGDKDYCFGHTVCFKKEKGKIYFDDQRIEVKDNECAIYTGTYKYQTKVGYKTVPIVKIIDSYYPDSE